MQIVLYKTPSQQNGDSSLLMEKKLPCCKTACEWVMGQETAGSSGC